jgi:hypothetical protein
VNVSEESGGVVAAISREHCIRNTSPKKMDHEERPECGDIDGGVTREVVHTTKWNVFIRAIANDEQMGHGMERKRGGVNRLSGCVKSSSEKISSSGKASLYHIIPVYARKVMWYNVDM